MEAVDFVRRHRAELAKRPVWLFSSGPLGAEVKDTEPQPKELEELREAVMPRDHRMFFGALDPTQLSFAERMVAKVVRASWGDYRNWDVINTWTDEIARSLTPAGTALGMGGPNLG
jgi:menaquinone-dependent protoporphyrinogen oxidase